MAEAFDPYHTWLGIPPEEQPANCYRLLGIRLFEDRAEVIEHAADQRMAHLKSVSAGEHVYLAQKLLNRVAAARVRLLDPYKKAMYDGRLRQELAARSPLADKPVGHASPPAAGATSPLSPAGRGAGGEGATKPSVPPTPGPPPADFSLAETAAGRPEPGGAPTITYTPLGQFGEYRLLEKLGEGGMGAVYKALHTKLDRVVALKLLSTKRVRDEHAPARFEREMKAVGAVDHPNVVRAMDARQIEGTSFLVMEYIEGVSLSVLARQCQPLPVADACEIVRQAALGLEAVRRHGLVHRDVKPSNLMVTPQGMVKLLDLGLARFQSQAESEDEVTATGAAMGTADYMAPEQISDSRSVDIRADIYGLGCTLYKILTGQAPFSGPKYRSMTEKVAGHLQDRVPPIRELRGDVPPELVRLLERMLAKDPAKRPDTPAEVADAVGPLATTSDLAVLVARVQGSPAPQAQESPAATVETQSASSWTRFLERIVGRQAAATQSTATSAARRRRAPAVIPAVSVLVAVALGTVMVWAVLSLRGGQEAALRFDWPEAERRGLVVVIDGQEMALPASGPWEHRCAVGEHRVSATRPGFRMPEQVVQLQPGQTRRVSANWQRLPNLVLQWPAAERQGAMLEIDGKPCEIEPLALRSSAGQLQMVLDPGPHQLRLDRFGYQSIQRQIQIADGRQEVIRPEWQPVGQASLPAKPVVPVGPAVPEGGKAVPDTAQAPAGKADPTPAKPAVAPKPIEEDPAEKRRRLLAARWAESAGEAEKRIAAWDFAGAEKALATLRFEEPELSARLLARRDEVGRMAALKARIVQRINAAKPRLKKSDLALRGLGGEILEADENGITAKLISGKTESLAWSDVGEKAVPKILQLAADPDKADDWLAAGLMALASGDAALAERYFDAARQLGTNFDPYLVPLAEAGFARAKDLLDKKQFPEADAALVGIEAKYARIPWFASNKRAIAAAREVAKAGIVRNQEAESLYAEAARLLAKKELFDVKALVEKLRSDYADTEAVRARRRRPSMVEMERAVKDVPKPIRVRLDGRGDFKSIQGAIDAAPSKSLIEIEDDGPYKEKVLFPKDKYELRLRGKKGCWPVITSADLPPGPRPLVAVEGSGAFLERLVLLDGVLSVSAGDVRLRWLIVHGRIGTGGYQRKCECEECLVTTGASAEAPAVFRNCLFLGSAEAGHQLSLAVVGSEAHSCTILARTSCSLGGWPGGAARDSILGRVVTTSKLLIETCALLAGDVPEQSRGCFQADPMFIDPKNFDYRLKPGSPCIGKASDGGDIGCRYTPEMIELCKQALELRRKGILKF